MTAATIEEVVVELGKNKDYEEVIACIEQAIILGKIVQPWMHQALAISMEQAGRPKSAIERVLMSSQDVMGSDFDSVMKLANYLSRIERYDRAIELYRQASFLNPTSPEPFIRALELAQRIRNDDAVAWCAPEVYSYAWGLERDSLRRMAEQSAADAVTGLAASGKLSKALALQDAMQKAKQADLVVRLEFNGKGDVDLLVDEPAGETCSNSQRFTKAGGIFVHDGFGPNQANCFDEYICLKALPGEYRIRVRYVAGEIVGKRATLIVTRNRNTINETVDTQTVLLGQSDAIVRVSINGGRRERADAEVPDRKTSQVKRGTVNTVPLAQIGQNQAGQVGAIAGGGVVGYQPLVTWINEGVTMSAMATVSGDRRYVRINAAPSFNTITDVFTFTFSR